MTEDDKKLFQFLERENIRLLNKKKTLKSKIEIVDSDLLVVRDKMTSMAKLIEESKNEQNKPS